MFAINCYIIKLNTKTPFDIADKDGKKKAFSPAEKMKGEQSILLIGYSCARDEGKKRNGYPLKCLFHSFRKAPLSEVTHKHIWTTHRTQIHKTMSLGQMMNFMVWKFFLKFDVEVVGEDFRPTKSNTAYRRQKQKYGEDEVHSDHVGGLS